MHKHSHVFVHGRLHKPRRAVTGVGPMRVRSRGVAPSVRRVAMHVARCAWLTNHEPYVVTRVSFRHDTAPDTTLSLTPRRMPAALAAWVRRITTR